MDFRRTLLLIAVCLLLITGWNYYLQVRYKDYFEHRKQQHQAQPTPAATEPATTVEPVETRERSTQVDAEPAGPIMTGEIRASDQPSEDSVILGSTDPDGDYKIEVELSNRGPALTSILLRDHRANVERDDPYRLLTLPVDRAGNVTFNPLGIDQFKSNVTENAMDTSELLWTIHRETPTKEGQSARFTTSLNDSEGNLLADLAFTFRLLKESYKVEVEYELRNRRDQQQTVRLTINALGGVSKEDVRMEDRYLVVAQYSIADKTVNTRHIGAGKFNKKGGWFKGNDKGQIHSFELGASNESTDTPVAWLATSNKFFTAVMRPVGNSGDLAPAIGRFIDDSQAFPVVQSADGKNVNETRVPAARMGLKKELLEPGQVVTYPFELFLGPKARHLFEADDTYSALDYHQTIKFPGCSFAWLANLMLWFMDLLYGAVHNYGWVIIILVVTVRLAMHPLTRYQTINMTRFGKQMQRLQPKLDELKKKHGSNREAFNRAMMDLYKKEGVNPAGAMVGCLPMALQMPIWFALYGALQVAVELRHASLWPLGSWIGDLSGPDQLIRFGQSFNIPLLSGFMGPIESLNLLPILLGIAFFLQMKLQPSTGTGEQAAQQRRIMMIMTAFFPLAMYNLPSGLNLYIMTSTFWGVTESYFIKKHIKERDAAEEAGISYKQHRANQRSAKDRSSFHNSKPTKK